MSIPTHNLYDFIYQATERKFCVIYFYPFGQKDPKNITILNQIGDPAYQIDSSNLLSHKAYTPIMHKLDFVRKYSLQPVILCNDQEPLFFDLYNNSSMFIGNLWPKHCENIFHIYKDFNLRWAFPFNMQKYWILLHSEKNSKDLKKYEDTERFIGAYYWSHALLSLDWFRFAAYDTNLQYKHSNSKKFLVYCRDKSGSRQYRSMIQTQLANHNITDSCQFYSFMQENFVKSDASAEYNSYDISNTDLSIILETVFDERIHLTEKTCRAIATGHPFILAAGPGSLALLRDYGFKTFHPFIDESYDLEKNNLRRIDKILQSVVQYNNLSDESRRDILTKCRDIAIFNKKHFFSNNFFDSVISELDTNIQSAFTKTKHKMFDVDRFYNNWHVRQKNQQQINKMIATLPDDQQQFKKTLRRYEFSFFSHLKKGGTLENYVPPDSD